MTATPPLTAGGRVRFRRARLIALLSVIGPGLLAGLSDDDPPGITVYSVLGTEYGYELLWVLLISTVALIAFHSLGARMGVVTAQGLMGLIRDRYGSRYGGAALALLVLANLGTTWRSWQVWPLGSSSSAFPVTWRCQSSRSASRCWSWAVASIASSTF